MHLITPETAARAAVVADFDDRKARALAHYSAQAALTQRPTNPAHLSAWLAKIPASDLLREAQAIARDLALMQGYNHTPQAGTQHAVMTLGDAEVTVEYEVIEADSEAGYSAEVSIINVLVNGKWIDADELPGATLQRWAERIAGGL